MRLRHFSLDIALLTLAFSPPSRALATVYPTGFVWDRSADWVVRPDSDHGTSNGNPSRDALGNPVWRYEYVVGGGSLGSATPWYTQPSNLMVWDRNWFEADPTLGLWAHGDDRNPGISQTLLTHNLTNVASSRFDEVPLARWINPAYESIHLTIAGNMKVVWSGEYGSSSDVDVDVVLGLIDASTNTTSLLYSTTVNRPQNNVIDLPINLPSLHIDPGDQLFVSERGRTPVHARWIFLDDDLTFTVVAVPEPTMLSLICIGGLSLLRRKQRYWR